MTHKSLVALLSLLLCACTSGPFKINQSGHVAEVVDERPKTATRKTGFQVLIIPSGAVSTSVISDKASSAGGILGSMIVGPIAGFAGSMAGSTAASHAVSEAEAKATLDEERQDMVQAVSNANLPVDFAKRIADQLSRCGIDTAIYSQTLDANKANWMQSNLNLPASFTEQAAPYRFFMQVGVTTLQVRSGLKDNTLEGAAYIRVYETRSLRQIGRYAGNTGKTGSVTLQQFNAAESDRIRELTQAAQGVSQYLASRTGTDICSIMRKF